MKKVVLSAVAAILTVLGLSGVAVMSPAYAATTDKHPICANGQPSSTPDLKGCSEWGSTGGSNLSQDDLMNTLQVVINVIVGVIGFIAVAMIIMGGISFATSQGDSSKVAKARNTIIYGVVGLVIAMLAFAIVNFVLSNIF